MTILGIDYGLERVGTALSYGSLAEPLTVLSNDDSLISELQSLCSQYTVNKIVVGLSEQAMADKTKEFAQKLSTQLSLPIEFEDEALSSVEVEKRLRDTRQGKQQYRGAIDHFAAALILERFLDEHPEDE